VANDYFTATAIPSHTTARASDVNDRFTGVEAAFDLLPDPDVMKLAIKPTVVAGGSANALTVTNAQAVTAYTLGQEINFKAASTNTGPATVNVDGLGNKEIRRHDATALAAGDLISGRIYEAKYDGTYFQLMRVTATDLAAYTVAAAASAVAADASADAAALSQAAAAASAAAAAASAGSISSSNLMHLTGNETAAGTKTFSSAIVASAGITINGQTLSGLTAAGKSMAEAADAAAQRTALGLGSIATQASGSVAITGGSITGIADLAVADGGTGASTASAARTNLGLVIGTDVQAYDAELAAIAGLTSAADRLPYFTGSGTAALATFTSAGRALVDDVDASAQLTTLGFSTFGKTIIDDADGAAVRTTIGAAGSGAVTGSGLTMATARLLGRTTASSGAIEEISVSGFTLSGGVLSLPFAATVVSSTSVSLTTATPTSFTTPLATGGLVQSAVYRVTTRIQYTSSSTSTGLGIKVVKTGTINGISGTVRVYSNETVQNVHQVNSNNVGSAWSFANAAVTSTILVAEIDLIVDGVGASSPSIEIQAFNTGATGTIAAGSNSAVMTIERLS
jgi:hypothetical protein